MLQRLGFALLCLILGSQVQADGFDISLSDETAQIKYLYDTAQLGIGGADRGFGVFFNENDDILGSFQFLVTGNVVGTNRSVQLGAGFKAYAGVLDTPDDDTVAAVGIGGRLSYILPAKMPMALFLEAYIAPDVTSFADVEELKELSLGFEMEVAPSTRLYLGYRKLETDLELSATEYELDDSGHLGIRVSF